MRAGGVSRLPTRTVEICLAQDLVAEAESLGRERVDVLVGAGRAPDGDEPLAPRKLSEPPVPARIGEIDARLEAIYDEMRDHTGTLRLRGEPSGAWRRWADANPPRIDGTDDDGRPQFHPVDVDAAGGYCNASALLERLRDFAEAWDDQPISDEDWDYLISNAAPGDLKDVVRKIVDMQEAGGSLAPKSRKLSSGMGSVGVA